MPWGAAIGGAVSIAGQNKAYENSGTGINFPSSKKAAAEDDGLTLTDRLKKEKVAYDKKRAGAYVIGKD